MPDRLRLWTGRMLLAVLGAAAASAAQPDAVFAVQTLRAGGCGGVVPMAPALAHSVVLDQVAAAWAAGTPLSQASASHGYPPESLSGVHHTDTGGPLLEQLRRAQCLTLTNRNAQEIGVYQRGPQLWLVLGTGAGSHAPSRGGSPPTSPVPSTPASPAPAPPRTPTAPTAALADRALVLVNEARTRGARCGTRTFAPAPPLALSGTLGSVAYGHATDMAEHHYFEHADLTGQTPADRVRATGYREKLVGENIAYGPQTVDEAVQGWLHSPGHCENLMDPRFAEMGLAFAAGRGAQHGLYWVQVLAEPRV
jgi:uncharacterized protein YkwD